MRRLSCFRQNIDFIQEPYQVNGIIVLSYTGAMEGYFIILLMHSTVYFKFV